MSSISVGLVPETVNLEMVQGSTFRVTLTLTNKDGTPLVLPTGTTGLAQIRKTARDATVLFEMNGTNTGVSVDTITSQVTLYISDENTLLFEFRSAVWDLKLTEPNGDAFTYISGDVLVKSGVTR